MARKIVSQYWLRSMRYMDCEERKAEAEAENAPDMLKIDEVAIKK